MQIPPKFRTSEVWAASIFRLEPGEVVSVIGALRQRKTTLLRCLNFSNSPDGGRFWSTANPFDGTTGDQLEKNLRKTAAFRAGVSVVSTFLRSIRKAEHHARHGAAAREVPGYRADRRRVLADIRDRADAHLAEVGLSEKADFYPYQLSGGQQQRVAIARALALNPEILCFDEPTSALDPELSAEVLGTIRRLADIGRTMILVTHEMSFARQVASRVLFMADGRSCEQGEPEAIFGAPQSPRLQSFLQNA